MASPDQDVWNLSEEDFPETSAIETQLGFLVRYGILAPSTRNTQPWAFSIQGNSVHLIADLSRALSTADPGRRELYISVGCALENVLVAAEHFGFGARVSYFPAAWNAELVATVTFARGGVPSEARAGATLQAILRRHNDTSVCRPVPVPKPLRARLVGCCVEADLRLYLTDDEQFRRWIDALTLQADRRELADASFRRELRYWIGRDVFGERLQTMARRNHEFVDGAALLGLICADGDTHLSHVRTGQLFERIWLTATETGLSIHPMSQTMRNPELRRAVGELLPSPSWIPQHLFLVGFSSSRDDHHTPRRPLDTVLV